MASNGEAPSNGTHDIGEVTYISSIPYLYFEGRCGEAMSWYKEVFGFKEEEKMPAQKRKAGSDEPLVLHGRLKAGALELFMADNVIEDHTISKSVRCPEALKATSFSHYVKCSDADLVFEKAIKSGAKVIAPLKDEFWGDRFGQFVDPFGYAWGISSAIKNFQEGDMKAAAAAYEAAANKGSSEPSSDPSEVPAKDPGSAEEKSVAEVAKA
eukprot:TRINITY_DN29557_c0_g1_i1.p1 TRINITY_DN29557_c0_g1~~TRINITY_DN29557_c0_g1_i1.p1  ORF type:complete len:211 (+),score=47.86 TRINITY_DN29557_c0_g1_i1:203-835(+)